jgi:putative tricarboxylic transport membrane protein
MLHNFIGGLGALGAPEAALLLVVGCLIGVFLGVLPGLGVALVLSVMLSFIYHLGVTPAIALMLATQAGSYFSASITAILLNTPGAPESLPTTFDGYPMATKGRGGQALGISATATCLGGLVGCVALFGLLQLVNYLPLVFHPPEYVALIVLAVVLTGTLGTDSLSKALLSASFGLMISFIGNDPVTGDDRFTFGQTSLYGGIDVVALALGVFAISQMVFMYGTNKAVTGLGAKALAPGFQRQVLEGIREALRHWFLIVRSAAVGVICGIVPGIGGFTANFLSYGIAKQTSKNGKDYGTGVAEGIIAPEGSSLAKEAGSLVPAIGLGLPSGTGMVLFIAALAILGLSPGPGFAAAHPELPYTMLWTVAIAGVLGTAVGLVAAPVLARVTRVRGPLLLPFIFGVSVVGAYAVNVSMADVLELVVFAFVGVILRRLHYSLAALAVGLVLGSQFEDNVFLTHQIFGWDFYSRPLTDILFALVIAALAAQVVQRRRRKATAAREWAAAGHGSQRPSATDAYPVMEFSVSAGMLALSIFYVLVARTYSSNDRLLPLIVGAIAVIVAAVQSVTTARDLIGYRRRRAASSDGEGPAQAAAAAEAGQPVTPSASNGGTPSAGGTPAAVGTPSAGGTPAAVGTPLAGVLASARKLRRSARTATLVQPAAEAEVSGAPGEAGGLPLRPADDGPVISKRRLYSRELIALGWVIVMALAADLLGFKIGVPVVVFLYGLLGSGCTSLKSRLVFAAASTVVMAVLTYEIFNVLHLTFQGMLGL